MHAVVSLPVGDLGFLFVSLYLVVTLPASLCKQQTDIVALWHTGHLHHWHRRHLHIVAFWHQRHLHIVAFWHQRHLHIVTFWH